MWGYSGVSPHCHCCPVMPPMEEGKHIATSPFVWALFLRQTSRLRLLCHYYKQANWSYLDHVLAFSDMISKF